VSKIHSGVEASISWSLTMRWDDATN